MKKGENGKVDESSSLRYACHVVASEVFNEPGFSCPGERYATLVATADPARTFDDSARGGSVAYLLACFSDIACGSAGRFQIGITCMFSSRALRSSALS